MKLLSLAHAPTPAVGAALPSGRGRWSAPFLALAVLAAAAAIGAAAGKVPIALDAQLGILGRALLGLDVPVTWTLSTEPIFLEIRLPRIVLAALVGAALSVAGAGYQGIFRNPLADPYLLGIAPGAGLGAVLALTLPLPAWWYGAGAVQAAAFAGAMAAVGSVYALGRVGGATPVTTLLLAGVAVGSLLGAGTAYLMYLNGDRLLVVYGWLLGGFNVASWGQVRLVAPGVLVGAAIIAVGGRTLNVLQLGEEQAAGLGVQVERSKAVLIAAAALATAAAESAAGLIGFVGLVVPHVVRLVLGPDYRRLVPVAALLGGAFLIAADALARSLPGPSEVPVGVLTALCGAPFFLVLLRQQKRSVF